MRNCWEKEKEKKGRERGEGQSRGTKILYVEWKKKGNL